MITILISLLEFIMWLFIILMVVAIIVFTIACCLISSRISEKERNNK